MNTKMNSRQSGFTLVELIVVIIILAILGAVALPKFIDVTERAQISAVRGAGGGLGAAVALVHAQWVANGETAANTTGVIGYGSDDVATNDDGWPTGIVDGATDSSCAGIWTGILQGAPTITADGGAVVGEEYSTDAPAAGVCTYTYHGGQATAPDYDFNGNGTADTNMTIVYDSTDGSVVVNTP